MQKRGQAATEFLTTYGWAIIILIMVTAAILSLGVFSPKAPNECKTDTPFNCKDAVFREGGFQVNLQVPNLLDAKVDQANVKINNLPCTNVKVMGNAINDFNLKEGENKITCYGDVNKVKENSLAKAEVGLIYKSESNLDHKIKIQASGQVEKGSYADNFDSSKILSYSYNNANSSTAIDNSYYSNDGILSINGVNCNIAGRLNNGCNFDGTGTITKNPGNNLILQNPHSFATWFSYKDFAEETWGALVGAPLGSPRVYINGNRGFNRNLCLQWTPGYENICTNNLDDNRWYFFVYTYDMNEDAINAKIYIDGQLQGQTYLNQPPQNNGIILGFSQWYFKGIMDETTFYNRILTPQEIKRYYDNTK